MRPRALALILASMPVEIRLYRCVRCNHRFQGAYYPQEAPICPKCRDSEWVEELKSVTGNDEYDDYG